jgi:hypothetical protein
MVFVTVVRSVLPELPPPLPNNATNNKIKTAAPITHTHGFENQSEVSFVTVTDFVEDEDDVSCANTTTCINNSKQNKANALKFPAIVKCFMYVLFKFENDLIDPIQQLGHGIYDLMNLTVFSFLTPGN